MWWIRETKNFLLHNNTAPLFVSAKNLSNLLQYDKTHVGGVDNWTK